MRTIAVALLAVAGLASGCASETSPTVREAKRHSLRYDLGVIEHWASEHKPATYAGSCYVVHGGGRVIVGFTEHQRGNLTRVRQIPGIVEARRIRGYAEEPRHTLRSLDAIEKAAITRQSIDGGAVRWLLNGWSVDVAHNVVVVGSEHPKRARALLKKTFGPHAPIKVEFGEEGVEI